MDNNVKPNNERLQAFIERIKAMREKKVNEQVNNDKLTSLIEKIKSAKKVEE